MIEIYHPITGRIEKKIMDVEGEEILYKIFYGVKTPVELAEQIQATSGWRNWLDGEMDQETFTKFLAHYIERAEEQIREVFREAGVKLEDVEEEMLNMRENRNREGG